MKNLLIAMIPVYIYYFPKSLIWIFFSKYVDRIYYEIIGEAVDARARKEKLKKAILNLISFLSFFSLLIGTFVTLLLEETFRSCLNSESTYLPFIIYFIIGIILIVRLLSKNLEATKIESLLVHSIVWSSACFILFCLQ